MKIKPSPFWRSWVKLRLDVSGRGQSYIHNSFRQRRISLRLKPARLFGGSTDEVDLPVPLEIESVLISLVNRC